MTMTIDEELLFSSGAEVTDFPLNEVIFTEGELPRYYFQIRSGTVKICNYHEDGREIIHSVPFDGHCVGESFLFTDKVYPVNAVAITACQILRLEKNKFLKMIQNHHHLLYNLQTYTAERMYFRYVMMNSLSSYDPRAKIKKVMDCLKSYNQYTLKYSYQFPFTRQQLASLTGLCVETVVRAIKKMEQEKIVRIEKGKIFY